MSRQKVNYKVHVEICEKMFSQVRVAKGATSVSTPIQESVSCIYLAASNIVRKFLSDQENAPTNVSPISPSLSDVSSLADSDETSIESYDSDSCRSLDFINRDKNAQSYLQELILMTTFAGSASTQSPSQLTDKLGRPVSLKSLLISLSVYWGIAAVLLGQANKDLNQSVEVLMSTNLTYSASISIQEDILRLLSSFLLLNSNSGAVHPAASMYSRLSVVIRTGFKTPLMFTTLLGLSVHSDLSLKQHERSAADQSCIQLVRMIAAIAPRDGLVFAEVSGCTPLAMVASFHSPVRSHSSEEKSLPLALVSVLCESCPSALTIPCGRGGLYPLHLAARDGESSVLEHIATYYPYTVPLKDSASRYALEIALDHSYLHSEAALLQLARTYPPAVIASREQVLLFASQKNVSVQLSEALIAMCGRFPSLEESACPEPTTECVVGSVSPRSVVSPCNPPSSVSPTVKGKNQQQKQCRITSSAVSKDLKSAAAYVMSSQVVQKVVSRPVISLSAFATSSGADRETMSSVVDSLLALNCVSISPNAADNLSSVSSDSMSSCGSGGGGGFKNAMKRRMNECALEEDAKCIRLC